jgi:choline-sulfatase
MFRRGRPTIGRAIVLSALAASLAACAPPNDEPPANLLLVTIDTLRPDHLGAYGYERPTAPHIDRFAESAVVFERAYATSSWTLPSVASLLTAEYPAGHRVRGKRSALAPGFVTITERLSAAGFATGAVVSHVFFARRYGLDQGFADYDDEQICNRIEDSHEAISSPAVTEKGLAWLASRRDAEDGRRWFLWLHYFDPHKEYLAHPGVSERFGEGAENRYDGEIAFTDAHLGEIFDALAELGFERDTLVIVVSDHGEAFGEHGVTGHRVSLHEEELRVVLIVRAPGIAPRHVVTPVSLVDVAPTVLELLDVSPLPPGAGASLVPALRGEPLARPPILAELRSALDWRKVDAVIDDRWKLMAHRTRGLSLYDLAADPGERRNVAAEEVAVAKRLRGELRALKLAARQRGEAVEAAPAAPLDPELGRQLEVLGYVEEPAEER